MFKNFYPTDFIIACFKNNVNVVITKEFIDCADYQLTKDFFSRTGIKINKEIGIGLGGKEFFFYKQGEVSQMYSSIIINNYANDVVINWKSRSGRIYKTSDTDLDCSDILFWFEGVDAVEYYKQLPPNDALPFKLKDLTYELTISALKMEMTIEMWPRQERLHDATSLIESIDKMIDGYNIRSEKKDRKDGVVHNWKRRKEDDRLVYDIDTGSAGAIFLKKFLLYLSKLNCFSKVWVS